jgi:hypothetical protein
MCDSSMLNGNKGKALVSVDMVSKHIKIDTFTQGVLEYTDGLYDTVIKSGFMLGQATKVHQFVSIDERFIRFGFKEKNADAENIIDRRTLMFTTKGVINNWVNQCTLLPSKSQF